MPTSAAALAAPAPPATAQRRAILCVLGAGFFFAIAAALIKATRAEPLPISEMVVFRCVVITLVMALVLRKQGGIVAAVRTSRPLGHAIRTLLGFVAMYATYIGYVRLPLATVTALGFAMPLCLTALSVPLLGERVGWRRGGAVLAGLVGVLAIVQPWHDAPADAPLDAVLIVLAGVVCWAVTMITIRKLGAAGERNATIVLWYCLGSLVIALFMAVPVWVTPSPRAALLLVLAGAVTAVAQILMTEAYRGGEATLVAPFEYGAIIHASLLGLLLWGEVPDGWSCAGFAVLIGAGLFIWSREAGVAVAPADRLRR